MGSAKYITILSECNTSLRLAIPLIASQVVSGLSNFIVTSMVARLGNDALAASALVWGVFGTLIKFFTGSLIAVSISISQGYGARDVVEIRTSTNQGAILAIGFATLGMLVMWLAPNLLFLTGQSYRVITLATPYFYSLSWSMAPYFLLVVVQQFFVGVSLSSLVLLITLVQIPLEIFFCYILIFGKLGCPTLGLCGVGYGLTATFITSIIIVALYISFTEKCRKYIQISCLLNKKYLFELINIGFPIGGMLCIEVFFFAVITFMVGKLGSDVLAAHQITFQYLLFSLSIIRGIAQGTTVRVGCEKKNKCGNTIKLLTYVNICIGFCLVLIFVILYTYFPKHIIALCFGSTYVKEHLLSMRYIIDFLFITNILLLSECFRLIFSAALNGLKDTKVPMYISVLVFGLIILPVSYLLGFGCGFGGFGVWWGMAIGLSIGAYIMFVRFKTTISRVAIYGPV